MAASPLARSLLALACFALLLADCSAHRHRSHRRGNAALPNCGEYLTGSATGDVVILPSIKSDGYQKNVNVNNIDNCYPSKKLSGSLIKACDPLGLPPPSILSLSILSQVVSCHTAGPCSDGMDISVTQFCSPK